MEEYQEKHQNSAGQHHRSPRERANIVKSPRRHHQKNEAEHKAVSVVEPVGGLKTVPYHIKRVDGEAGKEDKREKCSAELFSSVDLLVSEIKRDRKHHNRSTVHEGKPLGTDGVVGREEEL